MREKLRGLLQREMFVPNGPLEGADTPNRNREERICWNYNRGAAWSRDRSER